MIVSQNHWPDDPNWLWLWLWSNLCVAAAGAVVMAMHRSLSPLVDVALMVMSALARLLGRALDKRISTGTLTAPAAKGHLTPSYVMEPTPNGRVNVCALHTSPEYVLLMMDAFIEMAIFPALTSSVTEPAPVTLVFFPRVNDVGVNPETLPFVDASPQSFQLRLKVPPCTKLSAPAVPKASTAANLFMVSERFSLTKSCGTRKCSQLDRLS